MKTETPVPNMPNKKWMQFKCPKCGCDSWAESKICDVISYCDSLDVKHTAEGDTYDIVYTGRTEGLYDTPRDASYFCRGCGNVWKTVEDMVKDGAFVDAEQ